MMNFMKRKVSSNYKSRVEFFLIIIIFVKNIVVFKGKSIEFNRVYPSFGIIGICI